MSSPNKKFPLLLLKWWSTYKRDFPWRNTTDPYKILIAELLLRKTTSTQVAKIYKPLIERYPTPKSLANACEEELKQMIKSLGMENQRAKILTEIAKSLCERYGGIVPQDLEKLLTLPGVGLYTASAVRCLAYGEREPMVDTNAIRVLQRVFAYNTNKTRPRTDQHLWELARSLIPLDNAKHYNLALIDFASLICRPLKPRCKKCPVKEICANFKKSQP